MAGTCPKCHGTGFEVVVDDVGVGRAKPCRCRIPDRGARLRKAARIPRRYDHCSFETFEAHNPSHRAARAAAADWVERWPDLEEGQGILLHGPPGTGKTHLAVGILTALTSSKGARTLFYEQRELLKALQGTFDPGSGRSEAQVIGPVLAAEILVLDDLGAGRTTEWARDVLHEIIAHRYNRRLPMVLTTNCRLGGDGEESGGPAVAGGLTLTQRLGDALMSRLYEMCRFVSLEGTDYRRHILNAEIARH